MLPTNLECNKKRFICVTGFVIGHATFMNLSAAANAPVDTSSRTLKDLAIDSQANNTFDQLYDMATVTQPLDREKVTNAMMDEAQKAAPTSQYYLNLHINGVAEKEPIASFVNDNQIRVLTAGLKSYGVLLDDAANDQEYVDLDYYPWIEKQVDLEQQQLFLKIPAYKFAENIISVNDSVYREAETNTPGLYLNYDLTVNAIHPNSSQGFGALNELVYFNSFGVGSFSSLLQKNSVSPATAIRLETNWTVDNHKSMSSFKFGDSVSRPELWGGSVRFGGIQFSTNFAIQPNFVTFPLPAMAGVSGVPGNVDVYINDVMSLSKNVDRGPFVMNDLPVVTGQGNVSLVSKDILGRRQEVVIPYYVTPNLLKPGLEDFSFEAGFIRYDYGLKSNNYKELMASATYRRGLLPIWTIGLHSEITKPIRNIGMTNQILIGDYGTLNQSVAVSNSTNGQGSLVGLGFNRQTNGFGFGFNTQATYGNFATIDMIGGVPKPKLTTQVFAGYTMKDQGSIGLSYTERINRSTPNIKTPNTRFLTMNYQRPLKQNMFMNLYASCTAGSRLGNQIGLLLTWQPEHNTSVTSNTLLQEKNSSETLTLTNNLDPARGWGYDLSITQGAYQRYSGQFMGQTQYNDYNLRASSTSGMNAFEANSRGSIIRFGGVTRLSRYITESFGMIKAEGLTGTTIYSNNQPMGEVDKDGILFLPVLNPYQVNSLNVDLKKIPISKMLEDDRVTIVPGRRAGAIAEFKTVDSKTVYVNLQNESGKFYSPGSEIFEENTQQQCYVGMDGQVCLQIPPHVKQLHFKYENDPSFASVSDAELRGNGMDEKAIPAAVDHEHMANSNSSHPQHKSSPDVQQPKATATSIVDRTDGMPDVDGADAAPDKKIISRAIIDVHPENGQDGICHLGTYQCQM